MDCKRLRELLDGLLVEEPSEADRAALAKHADGCLQCAEAYAAALQALAAITHSCAYRASPQLKERIMKAAAQIDACDVRPSVAGVRGLRRTKLALALSAAALVLIAATVFFVRGPASTPPSTNSAFSILAQARAAEEAYFTGDALVHLVSEILVKPVSNPTLAQIRWLPFVSLEATGKPAYHQLKLPAQVGQGYAVDDQCWYDPAKGRFVRVLNAEGKPIYANSYDGSAVYWLDVAAKGAAKILRRPTVPGFQPPKSAAEVLSIAAGLHGDFKDNSFVLDTKDVVLEDGSQGRVVKAGIPPPDPKCQQDTYWLFTVRNDDHIITKMEWICAGESLLVVRRVKIEKVQHPTIDWDLASLQSRLEAVPQQPQASILSNMVVPDVTVKHMMEKAAFKVYLFSEAPPWTNDCHIADILDIVSPPQRMFCVVYLAKDGRHVVLFQSPSYNRMLGPMTKMAKLAYTSPGGIKVWSMPQGPWLANILLQSGRGCGIKDPPSEDRTGYLLETPAGTFPALAINGNLTDAELHAMIDSLEIARP